MSKSKSRKRMISSALAAGGLALAAAVTFTGQAVAADGTAVTQSADPWAELADIENLLVELDQAGNELPDAPVEPVRPDLVPPDAQWPSDAADLGGAGTSQADAGSAVGEVSSSDASSGTAGTSSSGDVELGAGEVPSGAADPGGAETSLGDAGSAVGEVSSSDASSGSAGTSSSGDVEPPPAEPRTEARVELGDAETVPDAKAGDEQPAYTGSNGLVPVEADERIVTQSAPQRPVVQRPVTQQPETKPAQPVPADTPAVEPPAVPDKGEQQHQEESSEVVAQQPAEKSTSTGELVALGGLGALLLAGVGTGVALHRRRTARAGM